MGSISFKTIAKIIEKDGWTSVKSGEDCIVYKGRRAEYELAFSNWDSDEKCELELKTSHPSRIVTVENLVLAGAADPGQAVKDFLADMHYRYLDDWA